MKVSQIIYELIKDEFPTAEVHFNHIPQTVNLQSTTGIVLIMDMSSVSEGSKDLTSATRVYDSVCRIEVIGHQDSYLTLETLKDQIYTTMVGYSDTDIAVVDFAREYRDGNSVAEVKRFIQDFQIIHTK